jgi:hypothetical protein
VRLMTTEEASAAVGAIGDELEALGLPRDFATAMPPATIASFALLDSNARHRVIAAIAQAGEAGTAETTGSARRASTRSRRDAPR